MLNRDVDGTLGRRFGSLRVLGDPGEIRTHDLQIRNLLLYPAELRDRLAPT